ncbi:hypothetical protein KVR01_006513 [Diaporthe batatas]|uniref:uncharacterized protein n=1 Tax=Diaporthe batatas TaxID=748121 RepID=UPI001D036421|nr:uncharacterized protein KVR01_006513 [Diaporthe batatas]KAG8163216.1 hypothetical protein KVR01_006513 [Diaporthe batatas]
MTVRGMNMSDSRAAVLEGTEYCRGLPKRLDKVAPGARNLLTSIHRAFESLPVGSQSSSGEILLRPQTAQKYTMRCFMAVVTILMAVMVNMANTTPLIQATAIILATALVGVATPSGFQHSVMSAPDSAGRVAVESSPVMHRRTKDTGGCFHSSNHTSIPDNDTSAWIPWIALASPDEPTAQKALSDTISALCRRNSATILTRGIPYTHCQPDDYSNGTYAVMAQMTYLGPRDMFDMRDTYDYRCCLAAISLTEYCEYGGALDLAFDLGGGPNNSHSWNVRARPIVGPCPDCTGGLLGGDGKCRDC